MTSVGWRGIGIVEVLAYFVARLKLLCVLALVAVVVGCLLAFAGSRNSAPSYFGEVRYSVPTVAREHYLLDGPGVASRKAQAVEQLLTSDGMAARVSKSLLGGRSIEASESAIDVTRSKDGTVVRIEASAAEGAIAESIVDFLASEALAFERGGTFTGAGELVEVSATVITPPTELVDTRSLVKPAVLGVGGGLVAAGAVMALLALADTRIRSRASLLQVGSSSAPVPSLFEYNLDDARVAASALRGFLGTERGAVMHFVDVGGPEATTAMIDALALEQSAGGSTVLVLRGLVSGSTTGTFEDPPTSVGGGVRTVSVGVELDGSVERAREGLKALAAGYDYVISSSGPPSSGSIAWSLARSAASVYLVVHDGESRRGATADALAAYAEGGVAVDGLIYVRAHRRRNGASD